MSWKVWTAIWAVSAAWTAGTWGLATVIGGWSFLVVLPILFFGLGWFVTHD